MKMKLGKQEMQMLAYLQMRKRQVVKTGELIEPLQLSREMIPAILPSLWERI
jgi:hypothetical protein